MLIEGTLVYFKVHDVPYYTSGIVVNSDLVLVPGIVLLPFTEVDDWVSSFLKSDSTEFTPNLDSSKILFRAFLEMKNEEREAYQKRKLLECRISRILKCRPVSESVNILFSEWSLGHLISLNQNQSNQYKDILRDLISVFVFLRREDRLALSDDVNVLVDLASNLIEPSRGQRVEIVSTPFANELFMNSLSHGIISNVTGVDNCIILSDARTAAGSEGGPIFASKKLEENERKLIGLVVCSLSWWRSEWVGLTIGINLTPVLRMFVTQNDDRNDNSSFRRKLNNNGSDLLPVGLFDETVVLIRSRTGWGSGIVLSAASGVILTCSHVVKNDKKVSVLYKAELWPADVIFRSQENIAYDLAVIKTEENFVFQKHIEFSKFPAEIGDEVFAAGFPFFTERHDLNIKPTVVYGSISKVNPFMIQTTCCIQSGFSGGPLIKNGELLGIICSSAKNSAVGTSYPHINFCIPSSVFRKPVLKYIKQNDVESLKELESSSSRVQLLWRLETSKL